MGGVHELSTVAGAGVPGPAGAEPIPPGVRLARDPMGVWYVPERADIEWLLLDRRLRGVGLAIFDAMGIPDGPLRRWYGRLMFTTEGEEHHRLRSLVQRAFTPKAIEGLRGFAHDEARRLVAPLAATGEGDLVKLAFQLPIRAMARLLGVPAGDIDRFTAASADLARVFGFMTPDQVVAADAALAYLQSYVNGLLDARRADPGPDLITALLAVEDEGDRLSHDEVTSMVINLLVGGHDTTTSQIACTLWVLLAYPGRLRCRRPLLPRRRDGPDARRGGGARHRCPSAHGPAHRAGRVAPVDPRARRVPGRPAGAVRYLIEEGRQREARWGRI